MPTPRQSAPRKSKPRGRSSGPPPAEASRPSAWRLPNVSPRGLTRMGGRVICIGMVVGAMTVAAGWHASGMVRRGEIQRMVRMSGSLPPQPIETKNRGRLDKARLEAMAASAGR